MNSAFLRGERFEFYGLDISQKMDIKEITTKEGTVIITGNRHQRYEFMIEQLKQLDNSSCALFAHALDGSMCSAVKTSVGEKICYFTDEQDDFINIYAFKDVSNYFKIKKYALLIQISMNEWQIVDK